ncbi:MAG TPA: FAD-dependent oxidoreductase [Nitrosopumilaceae archaeon]|nr:FAD-dependent oxidoreductase [Nitrosopumilaceae archaeon]
MSKYDVAIIGGGILGGSISYWISALYDLKLCVIEKEEQVSMHASSRNTAVVHSPFYLDPKTKGVLAKSAIISYPMWEKLAKDRSVPWLKTGVYEIGFSDEQHKSLEEFMEWGDINGIPKGDLELLDGKEISKREPNVKCYSGVFCNREASTDFGAFTHEICKDSQNNGTKFLLNHNVKSIKKNNENITIIFKDNSEVTTNFLINCAGGNALDIAKMMGFAKEYSDLHFRGEYWITDPQYRDLVKSTIYTVAEFKGYPFLDPHWIKKANGDTEIGPNAVPVPSPETYNGYLGDIGTSISKLKEIVTGNALKLLSDSQFLSMVSKEWMSSISKTAMVKRVQKFIPKVKPEYFTKRGTAGIRSPVITPQGKFLLDVMEIANDDSYHIINYNSPGATGAPAYSALIIKKLQEKGFLDYTKKPKKSFWNFNDINF